MTEETKLNLLSEKRTRRKERGMKYWVLCLLIPVLVWGCQPVRSKATLEKLYELDPGGKIYVSPALKNNPPRRVAILPFRSSIGPGRIEGSRSLYTILTGNGNEEAQRMADRMREAFFGQFAQLEFQELKITQVDRILAENGLRSWEEVRTLAPQRLGELLGADALIYGEVTQFDYYYAFLYAQLAAGLSIEMIDTRSGEVLWRAHDARRDHAIRISIDPVGLGVGLFQIAFHLRPISMMRAMDEACRELVATIPPPHFPPEKS